MVLVMMDQPGSVGRMWLREVAETSYNIEAPLSIQNCRKDSGKESLIKIVASHSQPRQDQNENLPRIDSWKKKGGDLEAAP